MGSGHTLREENRPSSTQPNGTRGLASTSDGPLEESGPLTIRLERINSSVHNKTTVGAPVTVKGKAVQVEAGILGYIPEDHFRAVENRGLTGGHVKGLPEGRRPSAIVVLTT